MNRFLFAVLLALSFAAGACAPCEETTVLVVDPGNAPMPAYTDVVIEQAQVRCNRPIVGDIMWTPEPSDDGERGHCSWDDGRCPMRAWVTTPFVDENAFNGLSDTSACEPFGPLAGTAICTALAHEIGHWCLLVGTDGLSAAEHDAGEVVVEAWATAVRRAAIKQTIWGGGTK